MGLGIAVVGGGTYGWLQQGRRGPDDAAIAAAQACPAVTSALGRPLQRGSAQDFGPEDSESGGCNEVTYGVSVEGPSGAGFARYVSTYREDRWVIDMMTVTVPGGRVQAVPCESTTPTPTPREGSRRRR